MEFPGVNIGWMAATAMAAATLVTLAVNTVEKLVYSAILVLMVAVTLPATALKSKFNRSDRRSVLRTRGLNLR